MIINQQLEENMPIQQMAFTVAFQFSFCVVDADFNKNVCMGLYVYLLTSIIIITVLVGLYVHFIVLLEFSCCGM